MARIAFSALIYEIVGKLGGSVFQYSYGGWQVHVKNSPRNPQTKYQQLRRGDFGFLAASWRNLTSLQRQTFIDAAVTAPAAFNLFVTTNVNLILINQPTVTSYIPTSLPVTMPVVVEELSPGTFTIKASTVTTIVPADNSLLVYATNLKAPTKIFTNPSQYSPIAVFPAGSNISTATSILPEYIARFGQINADLRLCIKSVLIDTTNGSRGAESINCIISEEMSKVIPLADFFANAVNPSNANFVFYNYNMPANTMVTNGDKLYFKFAGQALGGADSKVVGINFGANGIDNPTVNSNVLWTIEGYAIRKDAATIRITMAIIYDGNQCFTNNYEFAGIDFTNVINVDLQGTADTANDITARSGYIMLIKAA